MSSNPPVAPAAPVAKADPAQKVAQDGAKLFSDLKDLLMYELAAHGYRPHASDIAGAVTRLQTLVTDAGGSASAYVASVEAKLKAYEDDIAAKAEAAHLVAVKAAADAEAAKVTNVPPTAPKVTLEPGAPIPAVPAKS